MSKFIDEIEAQFTGRVAPGLSPSPVTAKMNENLNLLPEYLKEYKFSVIWQRTAVCRTETERDLLLNNCRRELRESIYGDLRMKLLELERHIYEEKRQEAVGTIQEIIRMAFGL